MSSKNINRRLSAARSRSTGADSVFESLIRDYEASATAAESVALDAQVVVEEHKAVFQDATSHAAAARAKADRIRDFFGGEDQ